VRVAVTGVAGNVGRHVARELSAHGHEVVGVDLRESPELELSAFHAVDLENADALREAFAGCEAVVHLGGISRPGLVEDEVLFRINTMGTYNALEAAVSCGAKRFVFASSEAVLGFTTLTPGVHPVSVPIDEDHPLRPNDSYGLSKLLGEEMCRSYARRGAISTICLRTAFVLSAEWKDNSIDGIVNQDRAQRGLWGYVHADDAATAYRLACEAQDVEHETLFVVARDAAAVEPTMELLERLHPGTPQRVPVGEHGGLFDGARAKERLGFEPRRSWRDEISLDELQTH